MKEEKELVLYPNKNGTVKTLIEEAAKHVEFSEDGTRQLRMVTIQGYKIGQGPREDAELERTLHCIALLHFKSQYLPFNRQLIILY